MEKTSHRKMRFVARKTKQNPSSRIWTTDPKIVSRNTSYQIAGGPVKWPSTGGAGHIETGSSEDISEADTSTLRPAKAAAFPDQNSFFSKLHQQW